MVIDLSILELPKWALNFVDLGYRLADLPQSQRWVLAVSVPSRKFVSSLIAAGFLLNNHGIQQRSRFNMKSHVDWLKSLNIGEEVRYIEKPLSEKKHKTVFQFEGISSSEDGYCVCLKKGRVTHSIGTSKIHLVQQMNFSFCRDSFNTLDFVMRHITERKSSIDDTFKYLFPGIAIGAIIGNTGKNEEESNFEVKVKIPSVTNASMLLKDLIGINNRCYLFANSSGRISSFKDSRIPFLIYENLSIAGRYADELSSTVSVHVMDRSRRDFFEYREWIYHHFINRTDDHSSGFESCVPTVEFLLFKIY